jgi:hypothetical protein
MPPAPELCPLCGCANDCRLCTTTLYKDECWCARKEIPAALLQRVTPDSLHRACICRQCVDQFHRETEPPSAPQVLQPGDYYMDAKGLMVFTAAYHLRRGHCCQNNCRHCPYREAKA